MTILLRSADSVSIHHPALTAVVGQFDQRATVASVVQGADAVISVLGARKSGAQTVCSDAMRSIVPAMQTKGVRRLIALSAYGAAKSRNTSWFIRFVRTGIADKMRDKDQMEALVRTSGTDCTLMRPPALTNGKASERYRSGIGLKPGMTGRLLRADLAAFILRTAKSGNFIGQAPVVFT